MVVARTPLSTEACDGCRAGRCGSINNEAAARCLQSTVCAIPDWAQKRREEITPKMCSDLQAQELQDAWGMYMESFSSRDIACDTLFAPRQDLAIKPQGL